MTQSVGRIGLDLGLNYNQFNKDLSSIAPKSSNMIIGAFGKLGGLAATAFGAKMLFGFTKSSIKLGSDVAEIQNVIDVTFGNMAGDIQKFSTSAMQDFGLTELSAKKMSSTMGAMLKSANVGPQFKDMSIDLTKLTADMASFYNLDNEDMFQKIMAGMSGMAMPLKRLGFDMSVANLEAFALEQGLGKAYSKMSQGEQTMLRYNYMMAKTADQQGDFSRNSHNWAHSTRILAGQWETLKSTMGQGFINILQPIVRGLNLIIAKVQVAANYFKAFTTMLFGNSQAAKETSKSLGYVGGAAGSASKELDKSGKAAKKAGKSAALGALGFDEINVLMEETAGSASEVEDGLEDMGAGGVDFGDLGAGDIDLGEDEILAQVENLVQQMKNKFMSITGIPLVEGMRGLFEQIKQSFSDIWVPLKPILDTALSLLLTSWDGFVSTTVSVFRTLVLGIISVLTPYIELVKSIIVTVFESIQEFLELHGEDMRRVIIQAWELIQLGLETIINAIATVLTAIFGGLLDWWKENSADVKQVLLDTWNTIWLALESVWTVIYDVAKVMFEGLRKFFDNNAGKIAEVITAAWNLIWAILSGVWNLILAVAQHQFNGLKEFWIRWGDDILRVFEITWKVLSDVFGIFLDFLTGTFNIFSKLFKGDWEGAWEESKKSGERIWEGIKSVLSGLWDGIKLLASIVWTGIKDTVLSLWNKIASGIEATKNTLIEAIKSPFIIAQDWIESLIKSAFDWGKNLVGNIVDGIKSKVTAVKDAVSGVASTMKDFLGFSSPTKKGAGSTADKWTPNLMDMMAEGIDNNLGNIKKSVTLTADVLSGLNNPHARLGQPELSTVTRKQGSGASGGLGELESGKFADILSTALLNALTQVLPFMNNDSNQSSEDKEIIVNLEGTPLIRILMPLLDKELTRLGYKSIYQFN